MTEQYRNNRKLFKAKAYNLSWTAVSGIGNAAIHTYHKADVSGKLIPDFIITAGGQTLAVDAEDYHNSYISTQTIDNSLRKGHHIRGSSVLILSATTKISKSKYEYAQRKGISICILVTPTCKPVAKRLERYQQMGITVCNYQQNQHEANQTLTKFFEDSLSGKHSESSDGGQGYQNHQQNAKYPLIPLSDTKDSLYKDSLHINNLEDTHNSLNPSQYVDKQDKHQRFNDENASSRGISLSSLDSMGSSLKFQFEGSHPNIV